MRRGRAVRRLVLALGLVAAVCVVQGCSPFAEQAKKGGAGSVVVSYFKWRFEDLFETIDLGFTVTKKPYGGLYGHFASLTPFGVAYVDGHFVGIGGGQIGMTRHYIAGVGALVWGYEEVGWQEYNKDDLSTVQALGVGPIGLLAPPYGGPGSAPSWKHYLHVGYVGIVGNANYMEMVDCVAGFAGIDIGGDDGRVLGLWPWEPRTGPRKVSSTAKSLHDEFFSDMAGR